MLVGVSRSGRIRHSRECTLVYICHSANNRCDDEARKRVVEAGEEKERIDSAGGEERATEEMRVDLW